MRGYLGNRRWRGEPRLGPRRCCHGAYRRRGFTHMFKPEGEPVPAVGRAAVQRLPLERDGQGRALRPC